MKKKQFHKEMLYHASLSHFKAMLKNGIIYGDDYRVIDTIMRAKYSPLFAEKSCQISLDNKRE